MIYFKPNIFILCAEKQICEKELMVLPVLFNKSINSSFTKMPFLFCGNRQDRFKLLYWDGDGFLLCYKRIENGKLKWPRTKDEVRTLTNQQVRWLLEGLSIDQPRAILPGKKEFLSWGLTQKCVEPLFLVRFLWYSVTKSVRFKVVKNFGNYRYVASVASRSP